MTKAIVKTQIRLHQLFANGGKREAGQGALEYIGMLIVAGVIVLALAKVAGEGDIGKAFKTAISKVTGGN